MSEKYRPALHLSPRSGWANDPNGLIRVDGTCHAFFQHEPHATRHGPMHWGHATSRDLVHWDEQPIALYPTPLGTCFSGSAVETSGGDIALFYTAHGEAADGASLEVQCLVHADRALQNFEHDPANPVVPNPGHRDFRDPKVIWHAATNRWIMVVTEGQSIGFYGSTDLAQWSHLSSFGEGQGRHSEGPWECPDLISLVAPSGERVWVLIVGLNPGGYAPGSGTQYFIGQFDGVRFSNANTAATELWLDYGRDYYAAQTVFDRDTAQPTLAIAWASNWLYANETPTVAFRGVFSLPRELRLVETPDGLRVAASVPRHVADRFDHFSLGAPVTPSSGTCRLTGSIDLQPGTESGIALFGEARPQISFRRGADGQAVLRLIRAPLAGLREFAHEYEVPLGLLETFDIEVFVDNGLVELAVGGGRVWATSLYFPADLAGSVALT